MQCEQTISMILVQGVEQTTIIVQGVAQTTILVQRVWGGVSGDVYRIFF